ncbi:winged helix DNA-binding domain-containing protein, partial [Fragilariopsis cylindrus CCMP1102]
MINTCDDPCVCSWSIDGTYFVVMNKSKFEKEIIPQFFKGNKFASFVRQLNYHGFRKRSNSDNSIRIDAATANYCGFYHPKFQQGRTDLLKDIKRPVYKKKEK